jgi:hypothetical protein
VNFYLLWLISGIQFSFFIIAAALAAVFNCIPIELPFLTPGNGFVANCTIFLWQVCFVAFVNVHFYKTSIAREWLLLA